MRIRFPTKQTVSNADMLTQSHWIDAQYTSDSPLHDDIFRRVSRAIALPDADTPLDCVARANVAWIWVE